MKTVTSYLGMSAKALETAEHLLATRPVIAAEGVSPFAENPR